MWAVAVETVEEAVVARRTDMGIALVIVFVFVLVTVAAMCVNKMLRADKRSRVAQRVRLDLQS